PKRKHRRVGAIQLARVEERILAQVAARDSAGHEGTRRSLVDEEGRFTQRDVFGLIVHVAAARRAGKRNQEDDGHRAETVHHEDTKSPKRHEGGLVQTSIVLLRVPSYLRESRSLVEHRQVATSSQRSTPP